MFHHQELSDRQLKFYGISLVALVFVFAALAKWRWSADVVASAMAIGGVALGAVYYGIPSTQRSIYHGFRTLTTPIQLVASAIILAIVYYVVLTPIGIALRLRGFGVQNLDGDQSSYWSDHRSPTDSSRYFDTY